MYSKGSEFTYRETTAQLRKPSAILQRVGQKVRAFLCSTAQVRDIKQTTFSSTSPENYLNNNKKIHFFHFHNISTIIFHGLFIKALRKAATQTSVRSSGWFWNSEREFLNHCHTFPKHYRNITIIFSSRSKTPGAQGFTLSFQELTMSRASAKSWKGERIPGLWLCKDKDPGPSGVIYLLATSGKRLSTKRAQGAIYPSASRKCPEEIR